MKKEIINDIFTSMLLLVLGIVILCCTPFALFNTSWAEMFSQNGNKIKFFVSIVCIIIYCLLYFIIKMKSRNNNKFKKGFFVYVLSLSIVGGLSFTIIPYILNHSLSGSIEITLFLIFVFFASLLLYSYTVKLVKKEITTITNHYIFNKRKQIIYCLSKCSYEEYENIRSENIYTCINNDTESIGTVIGILMSGLTSLAVMLSCTVYLFVLNFKLACVTFLLICLVIVIIIFFSQTVHKKWIISRDKQSDFFQYFNGLLKGFANLVVKERKMREFVEDVNIYNEQYADSRINAEVYNAYVDFVSESLIFSFLGFIIVVPPLISSSFQLSDISEFFVIFLMLKGHLDVILNSIPQISKISVSRRRINELLERLEKSSKNAVVLEKKDVFLQEFKELKYEAITYTYKKDIDKKFKIGPIDLEFKKGELTFIIGGNGSGKSTLGKVLTGLYQPDSGEVYYNSTNISGSKISELFSPIFYENYLFKKLYGIDVSDSKDVQKIIKKMKLEDKIKIENGMISDTNISTGQKKRVALVISYLEDMPIYFFDEWAAEQDPEFKYCFYMELLPQLKEQGKCVIVITHDDRYFEVADRIFKIEDGLCYNINKGEILRK